MKIRFSTFRIQLDHTFGISRSKNDWYDIVYIYLIDGDIIGRGEAAPSIRYNESLDIILSILKQKISLPEDCTQREVIFNHIYPQLKNIKALEAAFSMALWDWWGKKQKKSVSEIFKININNSPPTSFTIAIGNLEDIAEKVSKAEPYTILKVKLGTPSMDKEIITEIRQHTDKIIRVDANEGWDIDNALAMCKWMADQNIELVEQPFPANQLEHTALLRKKSPLDIYADENSIDSSDIIKINQAFDGINIKLMKCGSLEEGQRMINLARFHDMKIMLGCMVESSIGITAASYLAGQVDAVDLDGNLLINNDPYKGSKIIEGRLSLPKSNGLGVELKSKIENLM